MEQPVGPRRGRLRTRAWTSVSHGLYKPTLELEGPRQDLAAWALVLPPSGAFGHLTAARDSGWWLPPLPDDLPVFATSRPAEPRPRRAGLRVSRQPHPFDVVVRDGLPFTSPAETLLGCARDVGLLLLSLYVAWLPRTRFALDNALLRRTPATEGP